MKLVNNDNLAGLSDFELVQEMKNDNPNGLEEIYCRFAPKIFGLCINRLNKVSDAKDCVQEIFIKLWENRHRLVIHTSLVGFLSVMTKYHIYKIMEKNHRRSRLLSSDIFPDNELPNSPEYLYLTKEAFIKLEATVKLLPEKCRLTFELTEIGLATDGEASKILNVSEKTVQNLKSLVRNKIKRIL